MATDTRSCAQCGTAFTPRREHARFCSARCRVAWNRLNATGPQTVGDALDWTITAMRETIDRLLPARGWDQPQAFAAARAAGGWGPPAGAAPVRYQAGAPGGVPARPAPARRRVLAG